MSSLRIIIFTCFLIVSFTFQAEVDQTPDKCDLTDAAKARLSSQCFSELQNVIACMPPAEQDAWAKANENNTDVAMCFNCSNIKLSIKEGFLKKASSLGAKLTTKAQGKRKGMSCLKKFTEKLDTTSASEVDSALKSMVTYQKKGSECQANLVKNVENIMIKKRKLFCVPIADIKNMSITGSDDKVTDIKYSVDEAKSVVNEFLTFFECQASSSAMIMNDISTVGDVIATSTTCAETTTDSSTSGSSSSTSPPKSNSKKQSGKTLGTDVLTYIQAISNLSTNFQSQDFTTFITNLTNSFNGVNPINCNPGGFQLFLSNIDNSGKSGSFIELFNQAKGKCEKAYVLFVTNGQVTCSGNCNLEPFTLTFKDSTIVPKSYNIVAGCTTTDNFSYYTYTDLIDSTKIYTSLFYKGAKAKYNSNVRCLAKAKGCLPGGEQTGGDTRDGTCPAIKASCKTDLKTNCDKSGLLKVITAGNSSSPYPADCDATQLGLDATSDEFVKKCFEYIYTNFIRIGMNLSPASVIKSEDTLAAETEEDTENARLRILQTSDVVVSSDTTVYPVTFSDVQLTSTDVTVDSGTIQDGLTQITTDANNSNSVKFAYGLLFVILAFLI